MRSKSVNTNENDPMNWSWTVPRTKPVLRTRPINFKTRVGYYKKKGMAVPPVFNRSVTNRINRAQSPYSVLGIPKNSSRSVIRKTYLRLSKKYHPDKTGGNSNTFKKIKNAYDSLTK
jgi:hypothetical protein